MGTYRTLLGEARWRRPALLGMMLCISGVIGLWGIGFFAPELVGDVISNSLKAKGIAATEIGSEVAHWKGVNSIVQNLETELHRQQDHYLKLIEQNNIIFESKEKSYETEITQLRNELSKYQLNFRTL